MNHREAVLVLGLAGATSALDVPTAVITPSRLEMAIAREVTPRGWSERRAFLAVHLQVTTPGRDLLGVTGEVLEAVSATGASLVNDSTALMAAHGAGFSPELRAPSKRYRDPGLFHVQLTATDPAMVIARLRVRLHLHLGTGSRQTLRIGPWPSGTGVVVDVPGHPRFSALAHGGVRLEYDLDQVLGYRNLWFEVDGVPHGGNGRSDRDGPARAYAELSDPIPTGAQVAVDIAEVRSYAPVEVAFGPWSLADHGPRCAPDPVTLPLVEQPHAP